MDTTDSHAFLGTGWSFPPAFLAPAGGVRLVSDIEDIEQSLRILFTTSLGTRLLHPTYGCDLQRYLFEPLTATTTARLKDVVRTSILYHEPRITPERVALTEVDEGGILLIQVEYIVRSTNSRHNFVFPFYRNEAGGGGP